MTLPRELLEPLRKISVWKWGSRRAPHKPLLLLLALAEVQRGGDRWLHFAAVEERLRNLLLAFGPPAKSYHPEYPFWRLQNDGTFWEIPEREEVVALRGERLRTGDVPPSILRTVDARGGFSEPVFALLQARPDLVAELTSDILEKHFEASFHEEILDAVGMPWVPQLSARGKRSMEFREDLIRLYEHRCAVCGFDGMLGTSQFALEAAHVQWHAHGGPDKPQNGILMCSLHHKAFDRGALGLSEDRVILVSQHLHGGPQVRDTLIRFAGMPLSRPLEPEKVPARVFIRSHRREVFRDPARVME
jgi:putative restriction endonuclease